MKSVQPLLEAFGGFWKRCRYWYRLLEPARASLLVSLVVPVTFIFVDQGRDSLRRIASDPTAALGSVSFTAIAMLLALFATGLASCGWARFLLSCSFPGNHRRSLHSHFDDFVVRWMPRMCGIIPPCSMALAFFILAFEGRDKVLPFCLLGVCCLAEAGVLWAVCVRWYRREQDRRAVPLSGADGGTARPKYRYKDFADVWQDRRAVAIIGPTILANLAVAVAFTLWPVAFGQFVGSATVVLCAVAAWLCGGSILIYWASRYRVPIVALLLVLIAAFSLFNDNHDIRVIPGRAPEPATTTFRDALVAWHREVGARFPAPAPRPLYVVAAAGGGIRAAYWTASVLGEIEDRARAQGTSFAEHTFFLSGVSGGSLGGVTFVGLLAHGPVDGHTFRESARLLLDDDFLAPNVARLAFGDTLQQVLPFPVPLFDRAASLEDGWAAAWPANRKPDVLNASLQDLYRTGASNQVLLPHLMLNGTAVDSGRRIITSDLQLRSRIRQPGELAEGEVLDILLSAELLKDAPIRLSTAAHQSARFTYFGPAGRFPDGTRIVDGGYFENSAAATLMDAVEAIERVVTDEHWDDVQLRIVLIDNEPVRPAGPAQSSSFLSEALSPLRALFATRTARGSYAFAHAVDYDSRCADLVDAEGFRRSRVFEFHLSDRGTNLPLGWTLSRNAIDEMDDQLLHPFEAVNNPVIISNLLRNLPARVAP